MKWRRVRFLSFVQSNTIREIPMLFWLLRNAMLWIALGLSIQNAMTNVKLEKDVKRLRTKVHAARSAKKT